MSQKIINKRSSVITEDGKPKLPSSDTIDYGEIAINYADGVETLSIKNSANEIIEFKSKEYYEDIELVTSTALNDLNARMTDVETNKASSTHDHDDRYLKEHQDISHLATQDELNSKQDTLVSGTNIKTINEQSILGSGNIEIATPTKVSELENDISIVTLNDSTTIKESVDGTELVPIFDGENKAVSVNTLVNANKYTDMMVLDTYNQNLTEEQFIEIRERVKAGATFELRYHEPEGYTTYYCLGKPYNAEVEDVEIYIFNVDYYYASKDYSEAGDRIFLASENSGQYVFIDSLVSDLPAPMPVLRTPKFYYTGDGTQFLSNDGTYKTINVDTSAIEQRIDGVETTIEENELVTSTALNDLNTRMIDVETNKASSTHDHDDKYLTSEQVQAMIDAAIAAAMGNSGVTLPNEF